MAAYTKYSLQLLTFNILNISNLRHFAVPYWKYQKLYHDKVTVCNTKFEDAEKVKSCFVHGKDMLFKILDFNKTLQG